MVWKGDMTIIGPRPVIISDGPDEFSEQIIKKRTELGISKLKPGLFGYTQLFNYDLTVEETIREDLRHLNCNFFEKIKILAKISLKLTGCSGKNLK